MKVQIIIVSLLAMSVAIAGCNSKKTMTNTPTRNVSERLTDVNVERQIVSGLGGIVGLTQKNHRVGIDVFRGQVLLTGEVPNTEMREAIVQMASQVAQVNHINDYLKLSPEPKSQSHTLHENYLKSKMQAKLLKADVRASQYHIAVRDDIAYLMGVLTPTQHHYIEAAAKETQGILGLISLADVLVTQDELSTFTQSSYNAYNTNQTATSNNPSTQTAPAYAGATAVGGGYGAYPTEPTQNQPTPAVSSASSSAYVQLYQGTNNP